MFEAPVGQGRAGEVVRRAMQSVLVPVLQHLIAVHHPFVGEVGDWLVESVVTRGESFQVGNSAARSRISTEIERTSFEFALPF